MRQVTWTKALTVVTAIGGAIIGKWAVSDLFTQSTEDKTKLLMQAASELNANLPMNIDADNVLFSTVGMRNEFIYNYKLPNYEKENIDIPAFLGNMKPTITNSVCTIECMQTFRNMEIIVSYSYFDANQKQITEIKVDTKECPKT
ncbi:hypothetical protein J7384_16755 [Endozoicomonas sp. G2_1]|uniref:hypothetical protein n=1 Tax=Endozoicomonas sp. G2_1 TaxID=2821091 RepID=UPI001ADB24A7|nr:hypothetical protein [Endozoicomonas sp. G2_1]MBO9492013.1 hypothetical protein [Endozoicomonas sp. G2_1]